MAGRRKRARESSPDQTFLSFFDDDPNQDNRQQEDLDREHPDPAYSQDPEFADAKTGTDQSSASRPAAGPDQRQQSVANGDDSTSGPQNPGPTTPHLRRVLKRKPKKSASSSTQPADRASEFQEGSNSSALNQNDGHPDRQPESEQTTTSGAPSQSRLFESDSPQAANSTSETESRQASNDSPTSATVGRHLPAPHVPIPNPRTIDPNIPSSTETSTDLPKEIEEDAEPTSLSSRRTTPGLLPDNNAVEPQTADTIDDPSTAGRMSDMVEMVNRHLAQLGSEDLTEQALETLGKHGQVSQRVPNEVILASAGTGKTFQLSNRYLRLLALGQDPRHILATTFTRKAAGEILERIIHRLTDAALDDKAAQQLSQFIDLPVNRDDCRVLLKRMIRFLNGLQIGTLDSFFGQVARTFCFELDLPQSWQIINEQDEVRIQNRAIGLALNDTGVLDLLHLLEKGEAARGLSAQMRWAVQEVYPLFNQTALEAWKIPGAGEKLPEPPLDGLLSCLPLAEAEHGQRGRKTLQSLIEMAQAHRWDEVLKNTFAKNVRAGNPTYSRAQMPAALVQQIGSLLQYADDLFLSQLQERNTSAYLLMQHFDEHYRSMKSITGDLRFDNVQTRLARWVASLDDPAKRMVARLDFHIEHLLLDEFQDTVPQQWRILYPIARSLVQPASNENPTAIDHGTLFCVGDQKQAIYRWRGGDSRIFGTVQEHFPTVQRRAMNTSYRSSPIVLQVVNMVFDNLKRHPKSDQWMGLVEQWEQMFQKHEASPNHQDLSGYVTLEQPEDEEQDLLEFAAQRVARAYHECPGQTLGVLVPRNHDVAIMMGYLNRYQIPASEESGNPLSDSAAIQWLISLLQLLDHPGDTASWYHVLHSPVAPELFQGFTAQDLTAARKAFPVMQQPIWERLLNWAHQTRESLLTVGLGDTLSQWSQLIGKYGTARDRKRLKQATAAAYQYESPSPMRTSQLGRFLQDLKQIDRTHDRVRVMNIHQSKGLEFDVVVLTGLEAGLSTNIAQALVSYQPDLAKDPTIVCRYTSSENWDLLPREHQKMFADHRREHFNEKLCQLYVGMTRARRALHMVVAPITEEAPQSLAGILRTSLTDVQDQVSDNLLFQHGQADWCPVDASIETAAEVQDNADLPTSDSKLALATEQETNRIHKRAVIPLAPPLASPRRGLQRVSPSSLEGGSTFPLASLLSSRQRQSAFLKGEVIHGWFELIEWLDNPLPTEAAMRDRASKIDVDASHWEQWIPEFLAMTQGTRIRPTLCRDYYEGWNPRPGHPLELRVQNERPFAILDNGQLLNGFIDRLVTVSQNGRLLGADIVDFKTDRFDDPDDRDAMANRVAHYRPQLEAYRIAVAKLTHLPLENVSARLLFVSIDQVQAI